VAKATLGIAQWPSTWPGLSNPNYLGLIDADITGPSIPKLLSIFEDQRMIKGPDGIRPGDPKGIKVASMALLLPSRDSAVAWRGPMKMAAIKQFVRDVVWETWTFY
jgi:ATP-binding protein involved in chromosome partitioning